VLNVVGREASEEMLYFGLGIRIADSKLKLMQAHNGGGGVAVELDGYRSRRSLSGGSRSHSIGEWRSSVESCITALYVRAALKALDWALSIRRR